MKVWVLLISRNDSGASPYVYASKEKAVEAMKESYSAEISEYCTEYGGLENAEINQDEGWAYIDYRDGHTYFDIFVKEVL